ncbi:MAG: hypothetical protein M3524_12390, partial [Actinomycetota bacterium]|nr:hypothetical protein [Actinomycetota bacterium]
MGNVNARACRRFVGAALVLACMGGPLLPGPIAGASTDPQVKRAGAELEAARTRAGRLAVDLEAAAGEYEYARAHVARLNNEL